MREKIIDLLTIIVLVLSGILLLSSAMRLFIAFNDTFPLQTLQSYAGTVLAGLTIILVVMTLLTKKHPFYEYWVVIMIGGIVGANYAF